MAAREGAETERVNILVVDDRPTKLLAMEALLADLDENVVCVSSGADALRQLLDRDFAVVLLDVNMPEMDGFETAALIRRRRRCEHVPIIFMTADTDETHALLGYSLGAVDYVLTPAIPQILRTKVKVFVDLFRMAETLKRQVDQRVALAEARAARAAAEEASHRTGFLAEAGKTMARSLDLDSTVDAILRLVVPELAESAVLRVRAGGDQLVRTHGQDAHPASPSVRLDGDVGMRAAMDRASETMQTCVVSADPPGHGETVRGVACPLLARGRVVGVLGVAWGHAGLTESRQDIIPLVEDICGRAAIALDNSLLYREIEQRDVRKDRFVAMLAHELRNPLSAITSALGVLEVLGGRDGATVQARSVIGRQLQHLTQLVDDLLDVARVTTGKITLARSAVNLADSVERCLRIFAGSGKTEGYAISVDSQEVWVEADGTRLDQILMNLIGNALAYTPTGGSIGIRVQAASQAAVFEIEDSGMGMSPEVLQHAFELFFQGDRTPDRSNGGLGIGLTLVRQLVELHGGTIEAFSEGEGAGSRFTIRLPRRTARPSTQPRNDSLSATPRTRHRILVVEDNDDAREMLRMLLTLGGHEVHEAADGASALETARAAAPDLALVDVGLPGVDGYEVARRLRASSEDRELTLIAVTGYGQPEDRRRALEAGFDLHIVKPIDPNNLMATIASLPRRPTGDVTPPRV